MNFNDRKEIRREIGMLFQGGALFDSLTVEENVMFPAEHVHRNDASRKNLNVPISA